MKAVRQDVSFPKIEEKVLDYWKKNGIFEQSLDENLQASFSAETKQADKRQSYVFYDGPPFATGLPHYGHLLAGTIKDVVGRFFTMKGFHVDRRFGWDCHGLPVEFEIQKKLNLHGAKAIREYGVGKFNEECRNIVLRYTKEWEAFVERSGRWVDFSRQYRTMDIDFMESVWWAIKSLWDKELLYEGLKSVPYSWAINTPLSNFEANLNYKEVQDPAVTIRAEFFAEAAAELAVTLPADYSLVAYVWTTTPWTLPSNLALAVGPEMKYSVVENAEEKELVIIASELVEKYFPSEDVKCIAEISGNKLLGLEYQQFFPYFESYRENGAFKVYPGSFVTSDEGTGVVHMASFGEEDVNLFLENNIPVVDPVDEDGNFTDEVPDFSGLNIKQADPKIISALKEARKLVKHETITHSYPFCWRTDTPLMYKPVASWFVRVEAFREELMQMNSVINWVPGHLRDGRFGKWLEGARDWAISRNRFWGTPIPIWRCSSCKETRCLGSVTELEELAGRKVEDLHCHFIDEIIFPCTKCGEEMHRIREVLDCWFESGAMPYAQAHYPFENQEQFEQNFPADFIAEGLDQTRGWFYTLLALSTALFGRPAFKNVIVNGIVLAEDGKKMSKSLQNYPPPEKVMSEVGADAMRLYLLSSAATRGEDLRFSKDGVTQVVRQTLLPLWNAYNFLVTYALVDEWTPEKIPEEASTNLLDQWILSKTASLIEGVDAALSAYHLYAAAQPILDFVDQLTNWYIRLNRRRFWVGNKPGEREDKLHAYATLHRVLLNFTRVLAPLAPFISEEIYRNLSEEDAGHSASSVHLLPFPTVEELGGATINEQLEAAMDIFEEVIVLGRNLRNTHSLKVRQPLGTLTVIQPNQTLLENLKLLDGYLRDELNVKQIEYTANEEKFVLLKAQLNTKLLGRTLGPKLGSAGMKSLRGYVQNLSTEKIRELESGSSLSWEDIELSADSVLVTRTVKPGLDACQSSGSVTVLLDTRLTPELRLEGLAREFVNRVQKLRKDSALEVQDRIVIKYMTACPQISMALDEHKEYVMRETLAVEITDSSAETDLEGTGAFQAAQEIGDKSVIISITRIQG